MFDFTEKDSCGVGFIASRGVPPTHGMTLKVVECLADLDHRGAKFADGTGDGAGVLTEIPFELIRAELKELKIKALIININSPGGTVSATAELEQIIYEFKKNGYNVFTPNQNIRAIHRHEVIFHNRKDWISIDNTFKPMEYYCNIHKKQKKIFQRETN